MIYKRQHDFLMLSLIQELEALEHIFASMVTVVEIYSVVHRIQ